jgi:hypothetical protein
VAADCAAAGAAHINAAAITMAGSNAVASNSNFIRSNSNLASLLAVAHRTPGSALAPAPRQTDPAACYFRL